MYIYIYIYTNICRDVLSRILEAAVEYGRVSARGSSQSCRECPPAGHRGPEEAGPTLENGEWCCTIRMVGWALGVMATPPVLILLRHRHRRPPPLPLTLPVTSSHYQPLNTATDYLSTCLPSRLACLPPVDGLLICTSRSLEDFLPPCSAQGSSLDDIRRALAGIGMYTM